MFSSFFYFRLGQQKLFISSDQLLLHYIYGSFTAFLCVCMCYLYIKCYYVVFSLFNLCVKNEEIYVSPSSLLLSLLLPPSDTSSMFLKYFDGNISKLNQLPSYLHTIFFMCVTRSCSSFGVIKTTPKCLFFVYSLPLPAGGQYCLILLLFFVVRL